MLEEGHLNDIYDMFADQFHHPLLDGDKEKELIAEDKISGQRQFYSDKKLKENRSVVSK